MKKAKRLFPVLALGLVTVLAGAASASDDDEYGRGWRGGGMGHMMGRGSGMGGCMMGFGSDSMLDRIDGRLAFLKTELKISEQQKEAWDGLAQTVRNNAEVHNAMMRSMMREMHDGDFFKKSLPDRLIVQETHMETRLQQIKNARESVDVLYAVLDNSQKKSADEIVLPMMGMGCGKGMGMGRMMRRGMMRGQ